MAVASAQIDDEQIERLERAGIEFWKEFDD
jgi:hypothetical protein